MKSVRHGRGRTRESPPAASSRLPVTAAQPSPFHPSKRFGQNFLIDKQVANRIVSALGPRNDETIIEIGPGKGALTTQLIALADRVVAIEFDRQLIPVLADKFSGHNNFKLVEADALTTDFCAQILPARSARVVANLPYNISTAILQRLIEQRNCVTEMVLMLQREVVDRITAAPGSTERGFLTVLVEAYCEIEKLFDVAPGAFRPAPKVWSSVIRLRPHPEMLADVSDENLLRLVVSAGFAQRRKTMLNNLRNAPSPLQERLKAHGGASIVLCLAEVELQRRAETLTLGEWTRITRALE